LVVVVPLIVLVMGWFLAMLSLSRLVHPRRLNDSSDLDGSLSIVIPSRNEAANLAVLLPLLGDADVVVVDDHSDDTTAAVAKSLGANVIAAPPLPAGWRGKTWACHTGGLVSVSTTIAFVDADVRVDAATLRRLGEVASDGSLVSVQPWHDAGPTFEQCSMVPNLAALIGCGAFAPWSSRRRLAFGPILVTTRDAYERAGGFRAVADETVEDVALARRYRWVSVFSGRKIATFRMHRTRREFADGWTRVLRRGATAGSPFGVLATMVWIAALVAGLTSPVLYAVDAVLLFALSRVAGRFRWYTALLYPIPLAMFVVLCLRSLLVRRVRWRGRTVSR
jgi:4,4'-diaponeurosporenoate glycosyltransferase